MLSEEGNSIFDPSVAHQFVSVREAPTTVVGAPIPGPAWSQSSARIKTYIDDSGNPAFSFEDFTVQPPKGMPSLHAEVQAILREIADGTIPTPSCAISSTKKGTGQDSASASTGVTPERHASHPEDRNEVYLPGLLSNHSMLAQSRWWFTHKLSPRALDLGPGQEPFRPLWIEFTFSMDGSGHHVCRSLREYM